MKCLIRVIGLVMFWLLTLSAQQRILTLSEVIEKGRTALAPLRPTQVQWIADTPFFSYVVGYPGTEILVVGDARGKEPDRKITLAEMNRWLSATGIDTLGKFPKIGWRDEAHCWFWRGDSLLTVDLKKAQIRLHSYLQKKGENKDVAGRSLRTAFTRQGGLYLLEEAGKERLVARSDSAGIVFGEAVHRSEFGIRKGTFWSPQERYLAFYRKDERMVTDYPYLDFRQRPAVVKPEKYPMAGMNNHIATVGVYDLKSGETVWLKTGAPADQYLTNLTWSPDEKEIYLAQINRDQTKLRLVVYDAQSGKPLRTLFREQEAKYLDPQTGPLFLNQKPDRFLWLSRRDGWNHIYLYERNGELLKQLTSGPWEVTELHGADAGGTRVYFSTTRESPLNRDLYAADLESGELRRLTVGGGTHRVTLVGDGAYFVDIFSDLHTPAQSDLFDAAGRKLRTLLHSPNPLREYRLGEVKLMPLSAEDGTRLYARVIFPPGMNVNYRYPLLLYVYGGPHSQQVRNTWLGGNSSWMLWLHYLAAQGYIVLTVDNRGTDFRGRDFEQATFRQLGRVEIADQLAAVAELRAAGYIDSSRIGVVGWSYGGFMAASLMLRAPEVFTAGIAGAPVTDWRYYETVYTERYMDTPEANPEGYAQSSTLNYLPQLQGDLLLIHGTSDDIVMWQHSILFMEAALKAGKQVDYLIYPGHQHSIKGKGRGHLLEKMTGWLEAQF